MTAENAPLMDSHVASLTGAYWPQPWTCEDGGPRRWGVPFGQAGLGLQPGEQLEVAAVRDTFGTTALVRRDPGQLYALRHDVPLDGPQASHVDHWVERLDPETLEPIVCTQHLPGGPFWPGGIAAHANGDLHVVFGSWAHRLTPDLDLVAARELPVPRPHNSFVVLAGGELVTKDCHAPFGIIPSTVSVLDPETLEPACEPLRLPEPSIARLASDGESVTVVGTTTVYRLWLDRASRCLEIDAAWQPRYGPAPGRSFGWDPVLTGEHVLWMDQGRNHVDRTMRGSGDEPDPVRLWWAREDGAGEPRSVEISGLPFGTESNPPAWDPERRIVVAYDAGNAVLRAWRFDGDDLVDLWRRDGFAHAGHVIVHPDTRELIVQDFHDRAFMRRPFVRRTLRAPLARLSQSERARRASLRTGHDELVVVDLDTGEDKARVAVPSPCQAFLFPAPGFARDVYYQSLTTIARVVVQ